MPKKLALFILLAALTQVAAQPPSPTMVIKSLILRNQTAPIPSTTLLTPPQTGLFRVTAYIMPTVTNPNSESSWSVGVNWTDNTGFEAGISAQVFPANQSSNSFIEAVYAKSGKPVTFFVNQNGPPDGTAYDLVICVEKLI